MSKVEFKVGDRVRCYGQNQNGWFDVINEDGDSGTITGACGPAGIEVTMDNDYGEGRVCTFHPKQCRKLKKRQRKTVWLSRQLYEGEYGRGDTCWKSGIALKDPEEWIEFREVKRK